jgi:hypothetical protein
MAGGQREHHSLMPITANVVAVVAILAGLAGVVLTNWNQRVVARAQYVRGHLTETYLRLLEGVHVRGVMAEEAARLPPGVPSAVKQADLGSDGERQFAARLQAFGSQRVYDLWRELDMQTTQLVAVLNGVRVIHGMPPAAVEGIGEIEEVRRADARWQVVHAELVNVVRAELQFRPAAWRLVERWRVRRMLGRQYGAGPGDLGKPPAADGPGA